MTTPRERMMKTINTQASLDAYIKKHGKVFEGLMIFGDKLVFPSWCKFGDECEFGNRCEFGFGCEFGNGCKFGNVCEFGFWCKFGSRCEFGDECDFNARCKFGDFHHISFGGVGGSSRTGYFRVERDDIQLGCFRGTLAAFKEWVVKTHSENPLRLAEYLNTIKWLESLVELYKSKGALRHGKDNTKRSQGEFG